MVKLSLGRMSGPPLPELCLAELGEWVANRLSLRPEQCEVDEGQVMRLGMLSADLKEIQDPDWRFCRRDRVLDQARSRRGAAEDSGSVRGESPVELGRPR